MLEGLAAWILNTYVGEYVENLNTDQLSIALLQGDVELENLPLKKSALKSLDIPLEVRSGVIGKIVLHIPIRGLRSEPWSISIENLYLVAGPLTNLQYDEKTEKENEEIAKQVMLDALEAKWKILRQDKQEWATSSWFSYGTSMATNILENIQLNVKNVHFRYEDDKLNPESPFACGVIISHLSAQSTNQDGKPVYVQDHGDVMYKLVDLNNCSVYCDVDTKLIGSLSQTEFIVAMQADMLNYTREKDPHDYILQPISAKAQVKRYTSALPLRSSSTPRITVNFTMEAIDFQLGQDQFKCFGLWNREFDRHNRRRKYRKNRPINTVTERPSKWWKFAINCHLSRIHEERQRNTWDFILERSRILVDYYDTYMSHLTEGIINQYNENRKLEIEKELDFEELKIIRELVLSRLQTENKLSTFQSHSLPKSASSNEKHENIPGNQPGLFQRWFPGWGGWSQTSIATEDMTPSQSEVSLKSIDQSESDLFDVQSAVSTEIEREIMDVIQDSTENSSFLRKDTVFAKMKFTLSKGSFQLLESAKSESERGSRISLADLHCSTITMEFESRPRTSAMKFSLAVQGLQLKDTSNNFPDFAYLIWPQSQEKSDSKTKLDPSETDSPFCQIIFEKNPMTHFHRYRASIKTRPIDIVYNPTFLKKIKEFFTLPSSGSHRLDSLASNGKFRTFRKQTQEELQKTLKQFLESNQGRSKARWDINLDISAPKFIIPENLADPNCLRVVLDLGNFKLQTFTSRSTKHASSSAHKLDEDVNEDDFHTPLSTPPNEPNDFIDVSTLSNDIQSPSGLSSQTLQDHLYERYIIDLTDLQVLQGRSHDNWKQAYSKGTSKMHVIDKFTISLQLERRLVAMFDPRFPNMKISGNLPFLTFHLNEEKISALRHCWETVTSASNDASLIPQTLSSTSLDSLTDQKPDSSYEERNSKNEDGGADGQLIVFQFFINKLSLEVQSRGRALVELQVTGVEANISQKKLNSSLSLTVHSLLIVDALQTYGHDFELLVASHKNLVLDSTSGSIRGSNTASPSSPRSPNSPVDEMMSCLPSGSLHAMQDIFAQAFNKVTSAGPLGCTVGKDPSDHSLITMDTESGENIAEALISLEFEIIKSEKADSTVQTDMQILNLQCNSLDLIANQETLVELISFFNRTIAAKGRQPTAKGRQPKINPHIVQKKESKIVENKTDDNFHINADFSRLNILLPRFTEQNGKKIGRKISTATMSSAKIEAIFGDDWQVKGSLGGLHLSDVTPEASTYRQVFSIGDQDLNHIGTDMFETARDEHIFSSQHPSSRKNACLFKITKEIKKQKSLHDGFKTNEVIYAHIEMASVCYTHCPQFLEELTECLSAFHDYMSMVAHSIKTAATEVAYGLVGGWGDNPDNTGFSFAKREFSLSDMAGILLEDEESFQNEEQSSSVIKIMARMETPILVIPRKPNSSHVLLAHLGQMTITNSPKPMEFMTSCEDLTEQTDKIHISLINMNLFSADLEKLGILQPSGIQSVVGKKSFYYLLSQERGNKIIYNTAVDLVITKDSAEFNYINPNTTTDEYSDLHRRNTSTLDSLEVSNPNSIVEVTARIKTPMKVVLSKEVYEQFLETLDNLTYTEEVVPSSSNYDMKPSGECVEEHEPIAAPSSVDIPSQQSSETDQSESFMAKHFKFEVPLFEAELRGDFGEGEQGLVNLKLHDFSLNFQKDNNFLTNVQFRLRSLTMADLLEKENSLHRHIMVSQSSTTVHEAQRTYLSTSCPDSTIVLPIPTMPPSLPSSFQEESGFNSFHPGKTTSKSRLSKTSSSHTKNTVMYPCTPPPSPLRSQSPTHTTAETDDLVHIDVKLIDKKSQEYIDKYNKTNRFIDINFRCLETTINLQTWVMLMDFLGMGAKISDIPDSDVCNDSIEKKTVEIEEPVNSDINFSVESFTLVLNKETYELAKANIAHLETHIDQRDGNLDVKGQLGNISLLDNSPSGELYHERFLSVGRQALEFDFFKHGTPDYNLDREYDIYLKLKMASVRYVHTNRFQTEILAFCQHFLQLQEVLGRMRAASAGRHVPDQAMRGARIKLDIDAGSPILLIPQSSKSDDLLVADLGKLRITNCFKVDGTEGTIRFIDPQNQSDSTPTSDTYKMSASTPKKDGTKSMTESMYSEYLPKPSIDPMNQSIIGSLDRDVRDDDMFDNQDFFTTADIPSPDVMSSSVDPPKLSSSSSTQQTVRATSAQNLCSGLPSVCDSTPEFQCLLDVWRVRLTDIDLYTAKRVCKKDNKNGSMTTAADMEFPTSVIQREKGRLLQDKCVLELSLERNLEGDVSHAAPDWRMAGKLSSVFCHLDLEQYKLIRGILAHNLGENVEEFQRPMMSHLQEPKNFTVISGDVYNCINIDLDLRNVTVELLVSHDGPKSSEVSLAKLDFIQSKLIYDSFSNQSKDISLSSHAIVVSDTRYKCEPMNDRPNVFVNILQPKTESTNKELQLELHYRSTKESTQFTVLLNKMKVMCIFDWLVSVGDFLLTNPDNPFNTDNENSSAALLSPNPGPVRLRGASPLNVSQSLATKRGPFPEEVKIPFQGKLNLQDTQFIVVGDTTSLDTSAVILQSTAVIMYKPQAADKIIVCDLQSVEVFSCCLMAQEETAQSIIDPLTISIDLNSNPPVSSRPMKSEGLLEVAKALEHQRLLQVHFSTLNIRVSYQDMVLFMAIMNSLPQQALRAKQSSGVTRTESKISGPMFQLISMGFSKDDCCYALHHCHGNIEEAAIWLTKHAMLTKKEEKNNDFELTAIELKANSLYFCLIDDCGADVPLAEISLNGIDISQTMKPTIDGKAKLNIIGSYYNRNLSGWEPFLESWTCLLEWRAFKEPQEKLAIQVSSPDVLNINVTSMLINQYNDTKGTWTEDYSRHNISSSERGVSNDPEGQGQCLPQQRRRSPFIPYKLINKTGCNLHFTTATTTPTSGQKEDIQLAKDDHFITTTRWMLVKPDDEVPFKFSRREKVRHKKTHEMYHNQLLVKVDGWQKPSAVCVDKVGIYFRHVDSDNFTAQQRNGFPTRIKFSVKQERSAGKIITISSALMVINKLDTPVELKLENTDESGQYECLNILPNVPTALPLSRVYDRLWARPLELSLNFCDQPIGWEHVLCKGEVSNGIKQCDPIQGSGIYRFCVCVQRENYPTKEEVAAELDLDIDTFATLPGHTIYILPPLIIKSLIPIELVYYVKNTDISGSLKAGKEANIHAADVTKDFEIGINLENFEKCQELTIPPKTYNYFVRLRIYDKKNRRLDLGVRIITGKSGNVKLSISAPYWLLNKSGLPLIFKQEGSKNDAAGQFEEHEIARSVTPLLFSYYEKDEPNLVCIRLGKRHHGAEALPQWCNKISLENGSGTRQLHVVQRHTNRPDWLVDLQTQARLKLLLQLPNEIQVYNIGYQVKKGIGKFTDTKIITIAPRYEIDNQSHHKLAIAQKYLINNGNSENTFLTTLPKSKLPYHWPRMDLDQLLCIRIMDIPTCQWSGGFCVDKSKSFHVNMRDSEGRCLLLKVEIILQGPTFFIVLADAETMPPPFRLDNLSPIPVKFYQTEVTDDRLQTLLRPNTSVLYAWDEPILEPSLSLQIPGGMTATYNLNKLGEGTQLNYENYIYLAATHTFNRPVSSDRELVLDSTTENHIIFKRKEKDKRSQMWRMTSDGMLEHYGSMPPSEPAKSRPRGLVLDILDIAPQPTEIVPLILRKADDRRKSTQTWKFTDDGRLMSQAGPMCVQVLGGVNLLKDGAIAVLGPSPNFVPKLPDSPSYPCPVPAHMLISRQKLRPGSGCLSVQVIMDGPIRVLQIADRRHTEVVVKSLSCEMNDWEVYDMADRPSNPNDDETSYTTSHLEVTMSLKGGLGISLINDVPEELVYIKLNNIFLEVLKTPALTTLEINVGGVQVDNQMFGAQRPVVLFVTQTQQREGPDNTPALYISAHKLPSGKWNAEIYKHLIITTKRLTVQVEEKLLWKLMPFFGYKSDANHDMAKVDDDTQQVISAGSTVQAKRYYFGMLKLKTGRVTLSMVTASKLSPDLLAVKNSLSMHLIAFEEAKVDLDQFLMNHPFETSSFLLNEIMTHYTEELKSQAAKILGSVDFLGNPLGFVNDVTEGLSGLIKDGNVGGLFKNVTHGVSNTAAKMTGALSDGLTTISMDDKHNKTREDLRQVESGQGSSHVLAGIKGLGYGIYGGLTGIVTQSYSGAKEKGIGGFFKGAGKGLVGTVTKPVAGVLDFTSGMANAVRDTSRVSSRVHPPRVRDPRVNPGAQGLISSYSGALARAQWLLYSLNNNDYSEYIISLEYLGYGDNNLMAMVSSHSFRILKQKSKVSEEMLFVKLKDIVKAEFKVVFDDNGQSTENETQTRRLSEKIYLTLTMKADVSRSRDTSVKRPQIRCERINIAKKVCQQINYARNLFDDETHTLIQSELKDNSS